MRVQVLYQVLSATREPSGSERLLTYIDVDVLDDDVARSLVEPQSFTEEQTLVADADETLVAADWHAEVAGGVVGHLDRLLVGVAAAVLDGILSTALGGAAVCQAAALLSDTALGAEEVVGLVDHDDTGLIVG